MKILTKIIHAVNSVEGHGDRSSANPAFVQNFPDKNVELAIEQIKARSFVLNEMLESKQTKIVAGIYSIESGVVTFN